MAKLLNFALLLAGIVGVLFPAFVEPPPGQVAPGFTQSLIQLFLQPHADLGYAMRVLCLFVAIATGYLLFIWRWYRNTPLTAVYTRIEATFSADFATATVNREQILRANQPNVQAYFTEAKASTPTGTITALTMNASCTGRTLPTHEEIIGSPEKGFEIIQQFGAAMPYTWYTPLIPSYFYNRPYQDLSPFIRRNVVVRHQEATYINDFNTAHPRMRFNASSYPQLNLLVVLRFAERIPDSFKVGRVKTNAVIDVGYTPRSKTVVEIYLQRVERETLRIAWLPPEGMRLAT